MGPTDDVDSALVSVVGHSAANHLIRVAAGLESAIVGEDEVLHQVRQSLARALAAGPLDSRLQRLFELAIAVGRRARSRRAHASENLAQRAVRWLEERTHLDGRRVLVVGSGRMGGALARTANAAGAEMVIASRDRRRAAKLARVYGADSADLAEGAEIAPGCAAIAVALSGPWSALQPSPEGLPPIADISAPPAVPAAVSADLNGAYLSIDAIYTRDLPADHGYVASALPLVEAKTAEYLDWLGSRT